MGLAVVRLRRGGAVHDRVGGNLPEESQQFASIR
jgi:hypothetical protein